MGSLDLECFSDERLETASDTMERVPLGHRRDRD